MLALVSLNADPFADANAEDSGAGTKEYVHIRVQQRNGRKSLTTVQGLKKEFSYNKILKDLKKEFCCNGTVVQDPELGQVLYSPLNYFTSAMLVQFTSLHVVFFFFLGALVVCRSFNSKVISVRTSRVSWFR
ncbi:hypothetical protein BHM03_00052970, partial [Ensete ventricosum]